ncbi:MAG: undecaprenyl-diphosphate phosphatase [Candidatus Roizmanbacteria bacterium]|nr:undecaprenyl-diphosphate phosphatase [Candidatus Roizmanbacteria bacterium]
MTLLHATLLGIIEGLTEFLPISSTAHMIMGSRLMGLQQTEFLKFFEVVIQIGAIFAVVFLYFKQFFNIKLIKQLLFSFVPTAIIGFLLYKVIKTIFFESNILIAVSLIVIGIVFIVVEKMKLKEHKTIAQMTLQTAVLIGLAQALAVIPGVSRAGIVILAMMLLGFKRDEAAQYSFMLALPTLAAAAALDVIKMRSTSLSMNEIQMVIVGTGVAFIVAYFSMKWFVDFLQKKKLTGFGIYRITIGIISLFFR